LNLRVANIADIQAMIELERQCETAAHWTEGQYLSALPACGAALTSRLMLVMDEEIQDPPIQPGSRRALVGFLAARHQGPEWELENVVVAPAARRRGVGTRLLEELRNRVQAVGSEFVYLEVRETSQAARAFYEKWGFEESGRRRAYYSSPQEDAIVYQWKRSKRK
jgi:[ribosomal protein S18]-alanine N-acetyltransferase